MKPIFSIPLLLTIICFSISTSSAAPDGSKKLIQAWIDNLYRAIKHGDKDVISTYFKLGVPLAVCERTQSGFWKNTMRRGDELYEYLAKNGSEAVIYVNHAEEARRPSEDTRAIKAKLTVTGLGPDFVIPEVHFLVNGTVQMWFGDYVACGWASMNCREEN